MWCIDLQWRYSILFKSFIRWVILSIHIRLWDYPWWKWKESNHWVPFHPSSYLLLHEYNSPNQLSHKSSVIHTYSDLSSNESFNLINLVIEVEKYVQVSDKYGYHSVTSGLIEKRGRNYPHIMHDQVQTLGFYFTILDSSRTCQELKVFQHLLMVMLRFCNSGKPPELSQIWFLSHNPSLYMVSLDVNFFLKYVLYFRCNVSSFQYSTSDYIQ